MFSSHGHSTRTGYRRTRLLRVAVLCVASLLVLLGCRSRTANLRTFLYVANAGGSLSVFTVLSDSLKQLAGPFATVPHPSSMVTRPGGRYLYVVGLSRGNQPIGLVSSYSIGRDGLLTELDESPYAAGNNPGAVAVSPNGRYLYVTDPGAGASNSGVLGFSIQRDGSVRLLSGSPFSAGSYPVALTTSPNGRYLFVANSGGSANTPGSILTLAIHRDGSLSRVGSFAAGINPPVVDPSPMAVTPNSSHLYIVNSPGGTQAASLSAFSIAPNGSLEKLESFSFAVGLDPRELAVSSDGKYLYVTNGQSDSVSALTVGTDGSLTELDGSPISTGPNSWPEGIAVDPSGRRVYVTNSINNTISVLRVGENGTLTESRGSPFPARSRPEIISLTTIVAKRTPSDKQTPEPR